MRISAYVLAVSSCALMLTAVRASSGTVAVYGQCGGISYTGSTNCATGSTCTYQNDYYSQCLPLTNSGGSSTCAALYAQCGGKGYTGPTVCVAGSTCGYQNDYYSQCIPSDSSDTSTKTVTSSPTSSSNNPSLATATLYGQCGGQGYMGPTQCPDGSQCKYQNDYYSQCLPLSTPGFPSSSVTPISSTTPTGASSATAALYGQCGGREYSGPTQCPDGSQCDYQNDYYSQCLPGDSGSTSPTSISFTTTRSLSSTSSSPSSTSSSSAGSGATFKASFTEYGSTDNWGSGNCNVDTTACGFYTSPGYSAAVSQNEFGVGPGAGAGPACGTCWKLTAESDSSGNPLSNAGNSIIVMVTNLCPAAGNPLCAQNGLAGTNQYGANVNFDLCIDSGASAALFGNSGVGLAIGSAMMVPCSEWSGTVMH